jgi:hypothetical protein
MVRLTPDGVVCTHATLWSQASLDEYNDEAHGHFPLMLSTSSQARWTNDGSSWDKAYLLYQNNVLFLVPRKQSPS